MDRDHGCCPLLVGLHEAAGVGEELLVVGSAQRLAQQLVPLVGSLLQPVERLQKFTDVVWVHRVDVAFWLLHVNIFVDV